MVRKNENEYLASFIDICHPYFSCTSEKCEQREKKNLQMAVYIFYTTRLKKVYQ